MIIPVVKLIATVANVTRLGKAATVQGRAHGLLRRPLVPRYQDCLERSSEGLDADGEARDGCMKIS